LTSNAQTQADPSVAGETAASHLVTRIPRATPETPVSAVIGALQGERYECADTVFVTDADGKLVGIVRINDLLADGERKIRDIMEPEHEAVYMADDQEQIAMLAMQLNMIAVPVVDDDGRLIGAVPPEALFRILRAEHMEDLQRLAGIGPHEQGPIVALDAPMYDRFRRRLPWLIFGLVASSSITYLMAGFERTLSENVAVAFFVPALVYIAGAIGSQAVSVAVRGLASGTIPINRLLAQELLIGAAIGASLGAVTWLFVYAVFHHVALAFAVGLAVCGGGLLSAVVGFSLPWLFERFGSDPALGSGPVCTIIQDGASLLIYFVLVSFLLG
jgi:magnesium transporter